MDTVWYNCVHGEGLMTSHALDELIRRVESLPPEELSELAAYLAAKTAGERSAGPRRKWAEIRGKARYPMLGEDAQAWVSRNRREDDERRMPSGKGGG